MANPFVHVELNTTDVAAAKNFYGKLFDWTLEDVPMPSGSYTMIKVGTGTGGGMMKHPVPGAPSAWLAYVEVADIAAFAEEHDADITVNTIALTEEHVNALGLIKAPMDAKKRKRYPWWPHEWTVELEAVSPEDLAQIVPGAIEDLTDPDTRHAVIDREARERAELMSQLEEGES